MPRIQPTRLALSCRLLLGLTVCFALGGCAAKQTDSQTHVRVSQAFEHLLYSGLYVAKDGGFFKDQGLDVDISTAGGDAQAFAALSSGNVEFAQGDPAFVAIAAEKGWQGKVVGSAVDRAALWAITDNKTIKPFTDPIGFKNHRVATYPEPNTAYVVQKNLVQQAGLTPGKDTKIVQVAFGSELAALKSGAADIAATIEPNVSEVQNKGGTVVFSYADAYGPLAFTGVMTSQATLRTNSEMVRRFMRGYELGLQYLHTNFDESTDIVAKRFPHLDKATVRSALRRLLDSKCLPEHCLVDETAWRKLLELRVQVGDLKSMPNQDLIDNTFARSAAASQ